MAECSTITYTPPPEDEDYEIAQDAEETPGGLRWLDGRLQQEWKYRVHYASGYKRWVSSWRDVPTVESKEAE